MADLHQKPPGWVGLAAADRDFLEEAQMSITAALDVQTSLGTADCFT